MWTPKDKQTDGDLYDADADEPEVIYKDGSFREVDELPSQAEGDLETIEEDLEQKGLDTPDDEE